MRTNYDRIKAMDLYELAEYIKKEQEDTLSEGAVVPIEEIVEYLKMEV